MVLIPPEGDLRRQRKEAMKLVQYGGISKRKVEELPWSTGLLDIWKDPELLSMSSTGALCGVCCIACLPAKTFVDVQNGADVWKRSNIDSGLSASQVGIRGALGCKFSSPGWAMVWNMVVLTCFPPVRVFWRWRLRRKYVVQGMVIGDILAVTLCYICATLQEAREVRVGEDELFTALKRIDGAALPTTHIASYGVPPKSKYDPSSANKGVPKQVVMKSNEDARPIQ